MIMDGTGVQQSVLSTVYYRVAGVYSYNLELG